MNFLSKLFGSSKNEPNSESTGAKKSGRHLPINLIKELVLVACPDDKSENQWWHDTGLKKAFWSCNPELFDAFKEGYKDKSLTKLSFKSFVITSLQNNRTEVDVLLENISEKYSNCCYLIQSGVLKGFHPAEKEQKCKIFFAVVYTGPPDRKPWTETLSIETNIIPSETLIIPEGV